VVPGCVMTATLWLECGAMRGGGSGHHGEGGGACCGPTWIPTLVGIWLHAMASPSTVGSARSHHNDKQRCVT
jgi:hypothetical protein